MTVYRCSIVKVTGRRTLKSRGRNAGRQRLVTMQCGNEADTVRLVRIDGKVRAIGLCKYHRRKGGEDVG